MFGTTFILAIRSILRHKLRSILTALGIIIGVAAVVAMVTLGKATTAAVQQQISSARHQHPPDPSGPGLRPRRRRAAPARLQGRGCRPRSAAGRRRQRGRPQAQIDRDGDLSTAPIGRRRSTAPPTPFQVQPWPLVEGRSGTRAEEQAGKAVCIIGNTIRTNLFRGGAAVGDRIRVNGISCDVIGILSTRGQAGFGGDQDDVIIMPIKQVQRRFTGTRDIRLMLVGTDPDYDSAQVQSSITDLLRERRNITGGKDDDFNIFDTAQISADADRHDHVADPDRRRGGRDQPGRRRHRHHEHHARLGHRAHPRDRHPPGDRRGGREVLMQFLVEAVVLSMLGGLIGLLLAQIAVRRCRRWAACPSCSTYRSTSSPS
jgi:putative ABC transport system permease protein